MTHYYSEKQEGPFEPFLIPIHFKGEKIELYSASGVFSIKKLDKGTETLLKYSQIPEGNPSVLDLGCGYGVVGIITKKYHPEAEITQSDVNERALKLTRMNNRKHDLKNRVKKSHLFEKFTEEDKFDVILTNPPYVAGRKTIFALIEQAKNHLKTGGTLQLVARHNKGGKVLGEKMEQVFGNMEFLGKGSGFRVYCSEKE